MSRPTNAENDEIADLERMGRRAPSGSGGGDLNSPLFVDGKEGVQIGAMFVPGKYALRVVDLELKMSKGDWDEKKQIKKESIPYLELSLECFGAHAESDPNMVGETITDRLMCKGKGVTRFKVFAKAVGMWDDQTDSFNGVPGEFMGAEVWGTIKTEKTKDQNGNDRERSIIDFAGYEPIDKYPLVDNGFFGEGGGDHEAPVAAAPVPEEDDDDLGEGELRPLDDEPEPEPEPAQPVARPRARAAGQAGGQPPWK